MMKQTFQSPAGHTFLGAAFAASVAAC